MSAVFAQDALPNGGFEDWGTNPNYDQPAGWSTLNPLTYLLGKITAFKTNAPDVHSGNHAIRLVSKFITVTDFGPAVVTTGGINPAGIFGGIPIHSKPVAVTGWYKYFPLGNDQALLEVILYKNGVEIGSGTFNQPDSVTEWTSFRVELNYTSADIPDTIQINLFASQGGNSPPAEENSTLFIDDVAYDYATATDDITNKKELSIYPNPTSEKITVETGSLNDYLVIYSLDGRKRKATMAAGGLTEIAVNDLNAGLYLLAAQRRGGKAVMGLFEIKR